MRRVFSAVALMAFSASLAQAEMGSDVTARAPKTVGGFVPYCTDHFKDCRSMVLLVDIEQLSENDPHVCTIGIKDNDMATKSIVGWLAQHKQMHAMPTKTGISAAIKALWPC